MLHGSDLLRRRRFLTVAELFDQRFDVTLLGLPSFLASKSWRLRIRIRRCRPELDSEDEFIEFFLVS
jgi:hypothetical protein